MTNALYVDIKNLINSDSWQEAFVGKMGWGSGQNVQVRTQADDKTWHGHVVARLKGFSVIKIDVPELPDNQTLRNIDKALFKQFAERMTIISSPSATAWLWPRKRASGFLAPEIYTHETGKLPDYLAQKLSAISFSVREHTKGFTLGDVRDRVRGQFDTSKVTKKFYEDFKKQHESLTKAIQGLPESEAHSYSSLLLNRLMFIYFLQKKEFINGDPNYLRNCLTKLQALNTEVKFYSFYKDLLQVLFFNGLNKQPHEFSDPAIARILGDPPYVNGGIFGENELEQKGGIDIPDSAFEEIFNLFDSYTWHLDTSPTGNPNEINPEVIGYIFEQYINYTANGKKDNGAYYTPQDVCGYMAKNTLVPPLANFLNDSVADLFSDIAVNPIEYLSSDMLHGWNYETKDWISSPEGYLEIWEADPIGWHALDVAGHNSEINLPGETWVETFHRRDRVSALLSGMANGEIGACSNDLVTHPLDGVRVITKYLADSANSTQVSTFWKKLEKFSVIDPTCGSGAFLFAALEVLEDIYSAVLDGAERLALSSKLTDPNLQEAVTAAQRNRRYFVRRRVALNNLNGTDIMADAIETAKLRLFLALVSCLESGDELEPLPDLDFNFKVANLVVGFYNSDDASRVTEDMWVREELEKVEPDIRSYSRLHKEFNDSMIYGNHSNTEKTKQELIQKAKDLKSKCDAIYADAAGVQAGKVDEWVADNVPFHWFIEFPDIVNDGGFDAIIGNPPYIKSSQVPQAVKNTLLGFESKGCPDFYAVCYERSLQLLKPDGWHSMIVMISLACGAKFAPLRNVLSKKQGAEWWGTYGKRPDSLFAGIQVCNTILTLGPTGSKYSTSHRIFSKSTRSSLFSTTEFHQISRPEGEYPSRAGLANALLHRILDSQRKTGPKNGRKLFTMLTARYWYPVLPRPVPILNLDMTPSKQKHERLPEIDLVDRETLEVALAVLGGKISYLFWSATSNDMDSSNSFGEKTLGILEGVDDLTSLTELGSLVALEAQNSYFASNNAKMYYINLRWSDCRMHTDKFDRELLSLLGLSQQWRNLNVWYRQTMRSTGENSNGLAIPYTQIRNYQDWYESNFSD